MAAQGAVHLGVVATVSLKIEHRTGVQAPAEVVWEMIAEVSRWPEWSGIYSQASGVIGFGELLTLTLALPGEPAQVITPRVLDWAPNEAVHWRLSSAGGLISSVRYIEIERMHEAGCVFSNGSIELY